MIGSALSFSLPGIFGISPVVIGGGLNGGQMIGQRVLQLGERVLHVPVGRALGDTCEMTREAPGLGAVHNHQRA